MISCTPRPFNSSAPTPGGVLFRPRSGYYNSNNVQEQIESTIAQATAQVMLYNEMSKGWDHGETGLSHVKIQQNSSNGFRIVATHSQNGQWILNCNIHHRLKYHPATGTFHQWRDEQRQVYGLNFQSESDANAFCVVMRQVVELLHNQHVNGNGEYHSISHDNVYQTPHQHLTHNQSAPTFHEQEDMNPNFRRASQATHGNHLLTQQQRRASQGSNVSSNGGGSVYANQPPVAASPSRSAPGPPPAPPAPTAACPPPAPPPPPAGTIAPVNAPPAPPPPPPNLMNAKSNGGPSLADQIKAASQNGLRKTSGVKDNRSSSISENACAAPPSTSNGSHGNLISELAATINKRKITQAKADAVDSKSNISNGSSDSGCGIPPPPTGIKKWGETVKTNGHAESPKTHRKAGSGSSISSQEEVVQKAVNGISAPVTPEFLERFKADLMAEVRLEINKAKQDIIDALKEELSRR